MMKVARQPTGNRDVDRALAPLVVVANELTSIPILDGRLIERVELPDATTVKINHLLGRAWRGHIQCSLVGAVSAGRIDDVSGADEKRQLWLKATGYGATVTVTLWVF